MPKPKSYMRLICLVLPALACISTLAAADTLKMPNGELLQGTIVRETADAVVIRSDSFGELRVTRTPGLEVHRTTAAPAPQSAAPAVAPSAGATAQPQVNRSWIKTLLGLSDRWSAELEANLLFVSDTYRMSARGAEMTIGYKVPNPAKPNQPVHDYGLFGAYNFQKVDDFVIGDNAELALRYFYQPASSWLLAAQADWTRDQINGIESRTRALAVPAYRFIDTASTRFIAGAGPAFLSESLAIAGSPSSSDSLRDHGFRAALYELFQHQIRPGLTFRQTLVVLARPSNPAETFNLRFGVSLRRRLTPNLSLSLSHDYVRTESDQVVPPGAKGSAESIGTTKLMLGYNL